MSAPLSASIRLYGKGPYTLALLHGGPGARGSLAGLAAQVGQKRAAAELLQTAFSVEELLQELHAQIQTLAAPLALAGHSWGAWLALLYGAMHPQNVRHLVLISCPPLTDEFVPQILERRLALLTPPEAKAFQEALRQLEQNNASSPQALRTLEELSQKTDFAFPAPYDDSALEVDARQYQAVWPQAARLRTEGVLLQAARGLECPVSVLHGLQDPHPAAGVLEPLQACGIRPQTILWERCSHSPFAEKYAQQELCRFLQQA